MYASIKEAFYPFNPKCLADKYKPCNSGKETPEDADICREYREMCDVDLPIDYSGLVKKQHQVDHLPHVSDTNYMHAPPDIPLGVSTNSGAKLIHHDLAPRNDDPANDNPTHVMQEKVPAVQQVSDDGNVPNTDGGEPNVNNIHDAAPIGHTGYKPETRVFHENNRDALIAILITFGIAAFVFIAYLVFEYRQRPYKGYEQPGESSVTQTESIGTQSTNE